MSTINAINNQNTTGSNLTIDPGSGDSWVQFNINTTGEFRIGVDDTDDSFRISNGSALGTNDMFIMSSAGECTMPLQSAFMARPSSDLTDVTGDGTVYSPCAFDTAVFDRNSDYNTGTYTFTAPVTGIYCFVVSIGFEDITTSHTNNLIYITASGGEYRVDQLSFAAGQYVSGGIYTVNKSAIIPMTASDTAVLAVRFINGTKVVDISSTTYLSTFSGFLVC